MNQTELQRLRSMKAYWRDERDTARRRLEHASEESIERAQKRLDQAQARFEKAAEDLYFAEEKTA